MLPHGKVQASMSAMTKGRWALVMLVALCLAAGVAVLWQSAARESKPQYALDEGHQANIRVAVFPSEACALLHLAAARDFYTEAGLHVSFVNCPDEGAALDALTRGDAELAAVFDFTYARAAMRTREVSVCATIAKSHLSDLLFRRDAGVKSAATMAQARIARVDDTFARFQFEKFLLFQDLDATTLQVESLPAREILEGMESGALQGAFVGPPLIAVLQDRLSTNAVAWPRLSNQEHFLCLIAPDEWVDDAPGAIRAFLDALLRAENYVADSPRAARKELAAMRGLDPGHLARSWSRHHLSVTLPQSLLVALEDQARWNAQVPGTEVTARIPNFFHCIRVGPLQTIRPERVTMIH